MTDEERKAKEKAAISTAVNHLVPIQKVAIEELTATQNDTYTAPSGKAYTPVTVNVSGGGGDSDFSTAEVTFTNNVGAQFLISTAVDDGEDVASFPMIEGVHGRAQAILYKGTAFGLVLDEGVNVSTAGAVEYDDGFLIITGDCIITIS